KLVWFHACPATYRRGRNGFSSYEASPPRASPGRTWLANECREGIGKEKTLQGVRSVGLSGQARLSVVLAVSIPCIPVPGSAGTGGKAGLVFSRTGGKLSGPPGCT